MKVRKIAVLLAFFIIQSFYLSVIHGFWASIHKPLPVKILRRILEKKRLKEKARIKAEKFERRRPKWDANAPEKIKEVLKRGGILQATKLVRQ